jgi:hypothetical protein
VLSVAPIVSALVVVLSAVVAPSAAVVLSDVASS